MKIIYSFLIVFIISDCFAQPYLGEVPNIPAIRQPFHDNIDKSQQQILSLNCKHDSVFIASNNLDVNLYTTYALRSKVDFLQYYVENEKNITDVDKYRWLRGINDMLQDFAKACKEKRIDAVYLSDLVNAYYNAMQIQLANQSIKPIIEENELEVGTILLSNFAFENNKGINESKLILVYKLCKKHPENTLKILTKYPNLAGADSLIIDFAYLNPQELYDYAASNGVLGKKIRNIKEPLVATISQMATTNDGRYLFPFLDLILSKKVTVEDIKKTIADDDAYFKLLVSTQNFYELQSQTGKRPLAIDALTEKLKAKALENYITPINALHDESNTAVRFAKIQNLNSQELYFVTVMGEEELYTSSFISGVYPKMMEGLGNAKADSLFKIVHFGYYRKFLKMCASFNMLEDFLGKMDKPVAEDLMQNFASDLEQYSSLEEAVDVADSYGSIKDSATKRIIINTVRDHLQQHIKNEQPRGKIIYGLLNQILSSFDSANNKVAKLYTIPSVHQLSNSILKDDRGRINVQQFFYGDKDGKEFFNDFVNSFRNKDWHIVSKPNWVEVSSNSAVPITIYSNRPLNEEEGLDDAAQKKLNTYLDSLNIYPTISIHRGHSYYLKTSIKQITGNSKLVLLGSCGGYHSLSKVLNISTQAQIIASKQIGTGAINIAIIEMIMEQLKLGKDLSWQAVWATLENKFINRKELKERFDDYIPPYKNLGAIFIMAYNKALRNNPYASN